MTSDATATGAATRGRAAPAPLLDAGLPAGVRGGFTTRAGGEAGGGDFAGLNLGAHVGDDPGRVARHRDALRRALGARVLLVPTQVHGADVVHVPAADAERLAAHPPEADALVTTDPGVALAVVVADCVPVLVADPDAGVVGVAHAGRPGLVAGVVPALLAAVRDLGARRPLVRLGPSVCGACYEVPEPMAAAVASAVPAARARTRWGTAAVDVPAGVLAQCAAAGVPAGDVARVGGCTVEDPALFSYRRSGTTGRSGGAVVLDAPGAP
ncbi:polyphenol oxidase family protein [Kineococcus sp. SYSU DK004]|uniref:polyphenol oxidase family protein n=1 Tax=Kineococcus sp. SYSU DK004 TaxID=3383125 RepID=UPI003D7E5BF9